MYTALARSCESHYRYRLCHFPQMPFSSPITLSDTAHSHRSNSGGASGGEKAQPQMCLDILKTIWWGVLHLHSHFFGCNKGSPSNLLWCDDLSAMQATKCSLSYVIAEIPRPPTLDWVWSSDWTNDVKALINSCSSALGQGHTRELMQSIW